MINQLDRICYDKNEDKIFGIKSAILWGIRGNNQFPLLYFSKPKSISEEDYKEILDNLQISMTKPK